MSKKVLISIFALFVLLVSVAGFWWWGNGKKAEIINQEAIQQQKQAEETKNLEEKKQDKKNISEEFIPKKKRITNWNIYINTKYKYLFQYPEEDDWRVSFGGEVNNPPENERHSLRLTDYDFKEGHPVPQDKTLIFIFVNETDKNLDQLVASSLSKKEEFIGGIRFFKIDGNKEKPSWEGGTENVLTYITANNGFSYTFRAWPWSRIPKKSMTTFKAIISTLEFIQ